MIFLVILVALLAFSGMYLIVKNRLNRHNSNMYEMVGGAILVVIAFAIVWIGEPEYRNRRWNAAVSDGYAFYVDGQEVELENIRHYQYSHITYDEKEHKVFLH